MHTRFNGSKAALCAAFALLALALLPAAWAKEGGDQYPNGAENWFAGAVPPAGFYYVNYFGVYTGKLKDGAGDKVLLNGSTPSVDATFNAFRFVQVTHLRLFGADYGVHVIVPLVYQSVDLGGTASETNIGDIIINPVILAWHHPQWHAVAGLDIFVPTGYYDSNDARTSIGANYTGFDPLFGISYMPKSGWETSVKLMYDVKTTNAATQYHSGQELHADYAAGKHFGSRHSGPWMAGATGYFVEQTSDDTLSGVSVAPSPGLYDAGRRGRVLAVGPSLGYLNARHIIFMADWQHETLVRN
ncbi:MAG: transporter, partial [Acidobacteriaceae bacterium]